VSSLAIDSATPSTLYAGTADSVFKSTDSGEDWLPVKNGMGDDIQIKTLGIDAHLPTNLYAFTQDNRLYKTVNGGDTWNELDISQAADNPIDTVMVDPSGPDRLYAWSFDQIYQSLDGGGHWSQVKLGSMECCVREMAMDPSDPATLYYNLASLSPGSTPACPLKPGSIRW
jgi:photosystem II stability/assembly factor-like uncharacterized protein